MTPFWPYLIHFAALTAGLLGLSAMARAGRSPAVVLAVGAAISIVMGVFLFAISDPVRVLDDFRGSYYAAGTAVRTAPAGLAPKLELGVRGGFVNLPIVAYAFLPLGLLPVWVAAVVFTLLGLVCVLASWWLLVKLAGLDWYDAALLLFVFAGSGPLLYSFKEGNISHMLLVLLVGAFALLRRRQEFLAGLVLGMAAVLKLPLLLFGVYFALRGRWRVVAGVVLVCTAAGLASVAVFGWDMNVRWYEVCVKAYSSDPVRAFNVQSIHAFIARLRDGASSLRSWETTVLGTRPRYVVMAAVAALYLMGLLTSAAPRRLRGAGVRVLPRERVSEIEYMMVLLLVCVSSPLSWSHYYVWLLVQAAFFIGSTEHFREGVVTRWLGWTALMLAAPPVVLLRIPSKMLMELHARTSVSHLMFGGLLMLLLLAWARWKSFADDPVHTDLAGAYGPGTPMTCGGFRTHT